MALRNLQCMTGHPALRGLLRNSAAYTCSTHTPTTQDEMAINTSFMYTGFNSNQAANHRHFSAFTSGKLFPKSCSHRSSPLPVLRYEPRGMNDEDRATGKRCSIHQQSTKGDQQTKEHFILTPKGLFQASPLSWKPYLNLIRMDRPIGTWLLYLPCTWSISLAAAPGCLPDFSMLALFAAGSFFIRGAGCTINDMWDKDFDSRVARTKNRPLASGQLTYFQALTFLGTQLSISLAILLTMNWNTVFLGASSMALIIIYPLMKRVTYWPQIFLGLTFNWGALLGWSAIQGSCDLAVCLPLYASGIAWTLVYDTIYAFQDKDDDIQIGVKSTAIGLGDQSKPWLYGFSAVMIGGLNVVGIMCEQTLPYYLGVGVVAAHIIHQIKTVDLTNPDDCGKKFRSNRNLGIFFWVAIVIGNLMKTPLDKEADAQEESVKN